jgi:hypothetical protein
VSDADATPRVPRFPPDRYGRRREPVTGGGRTGRVVFFAVTGALVGLLLAVVLYQRYGAARYSPQVVGFDIADNQVALRFEVHKSSGGPAVCHIRARDRDGIEVGSADVEVPAGTTVLVTYTLVTTRRAVSAEIPVCQRR